MPLIASVQNKTKPRLIRPSDIAREYGIRYGTLRDLVHRGELPVIKIGRAWYLERADVERFIADRKESFAS